MQLNKHFSDLDDSEFIDLVKNTTLLLSSEDGGFYAKRSASLLSGISTLLGYKRDFQGEVFDIEVLLKNLCLDKCFSLASDTSIPLENRNQLQHYLKHLIGMDHEVFTSAQDAKINLKAYEQHAYNKNELVKAMIEMSSYKYPRTGE